RCLRGGLVAAVAAGVGLTAIAHYPALSLPLRVALSGEPTVGQPFPLRRFDPTIRLRGWRCLAAAVDKVRVELESAGEDPVVAAAFCPTRGEVAFYGGAPPPVHCFGPALAQRLSQYDLWRPNPTWDPEAFRGRTFIYIGDISGEVEAAFERLET